MGRVDPPELRQELARLDLEVAGQGGRRDEGFLELDVGLAVGGNLEDDVGLTLEIGIDGSVEDELEVLQGEAALGRVVAAQLERAIALAPDLVTLSIGPNDIT